VSDAAENLELVVGSLHATVGDATDVLVVEGEYLARPGQEGVHHVVEFGDLAGVVQVAEAVEGGQGLIPVAGGVEPVELLQDGTGLALSVVTAAENRAVSQLPLT